MNNSLIPVDKSFTNFLKNLDKRSSALERARQPYIGDWYEINTVLFSYYSNNWITVDSSLDVDIFFQVGDKIRIFQGGNEKFFYIIYIDGANNRIMLNAGDDFTYINSTLTYFAFSRLANPSGHPLIFDYSTGVQIQTSDGMNVYDDTSDFTGNIKEAKYSMNGSIVNIWYNLGTTSLRSGVISLQISSPFKARADSGDGIWQSGFLWEGSIDSGTDIDIISKWLNFTLLVGSFNTELGVNIDARNYGVFDSGMFGWASGFTIQI
jgi:hypothetical protein